MVTSEFDTDINNNKNFTFCSLLKQKTDFINLKEVLQT